MVKKRCGFCLRVLRADGTCQNEKCPRYVPEENAQPTQDNTHGQEVIEIGDEKHSIEIERMIR